MKQYEEKQFQDLLKPVAEEPSCQVLRTYRQHGKISTYDHCVNVARTSLRLAQRFHANVNEQALVRGAFLHDYYLYDWHDTHPRLHGIRHPKLAMQNAVRDFSISPLEAGIIQSHMWPLTLRSVPRSKEAILVCIADKICAFKEFLNLR